MFYTSKLQPLAVVDSAFRGLLKTSTFLKSVAPDLRGTSDARRVSADVYPSDWVAGRVEMCSPVNCASAARGALAREVSPTRVGDA